MTEELKALEQLERDIKNRIILAEDRQLKLCAVIKQALLELQAIKNADSSVALEGLKVNEDIFNEAARDDNYKDEIIYRDDTAIEAFIYNCNNITIEQALIKAQAQEKELAKYKELEEKIGCPLEIRERALKQCEFEGLYFETEDTDGFERVGTYRCYLCYDAFNGKFYWCCGWNAETWLDCYKKTWWLKKDKSE